MPWPWTVSAGRRECPALPVHSCPFCQLFVALWRITDRPVPADLREALILMYTVCLPWIRSKRTGLSRFVKVMFFCVPDPVVGPVGPDITLEVSGSKQHVFDGVWSQKPLSHTQTHTHTHGTWTLCPRKQLDECSINQVLGTGTLWPMKQRRCMGVP